MPRQAYGSSVSQTVSASVTWLDGFTEKVRVTVLSQPWTVVSVS